MSRSAVLATRAAAPDDRVLDMVDEALPRNHAAAPPPPPGQRAVALPLSVSEWATLYAPFPLTESAWTQMLAVLTAMKPALAVADDAEALGWAVARKGLDGDGAATVRLRPVAT